MTLAILSKYSEPNLHLLTASHQTLVSCQYFGDNSLEAIDFSCIQSVVVMIPHKPPCSDGSGDGLLEHDRDMRAVLEDKCFLSPAICRIWSKCTR